MWDDAGFDGHLGSEVWGTDGKGFACNPSRFAWKALIDRYKADEESVYNTWFIDNGDRLKAFRSVRQGVRQVIEDIRD